jgi:Zn finger protein HypA/HybF involved in hydrogenase expression
MYTYLQTKYKWTDATIKTIWWDKHGAALSSFQITKKVSIQKFVHNRCATKEREYIYYEFRSTYCTLCDQAIKINNHTMKCMQCRKRVNLRKNIQCNLRIN